MATQESAPPKVKIRSGFALKHETRLPASALRPDGPVPQLMQLRGRALAFWLFLAAVARPKDAVVQDKYQKLAKAMEIQNPGGARGTVSHWVAALEKLKLLKKVPEGIQLLALDGTGNGYSIPGAPFIVLPADFFYNGWHLTLSAAAVTVYLIGLNEITRQWHFSGSVGVWSKRGLVIADHYGIARSTFEAGKKELGEYGLLGYTPMAHGDERAPQTYYMMRSHVLAMSPDQAKLEAQREDDSVLPIRHVSPKTGRTQRYSWRMRWAREINAALEELAKREVVNDAEKRKTLSRSAETTTT